MHGSSAIAAAADAGSRRKYHDCSKSRTKSACLTPSLGCHSTRYVPNARGWYAYPVRTVRGTLGASRTVRPVRTQRGRLVRVARTYPTEAPRRACQLGAEAARTIRPAQGEKTDFMGFHALGASPG